MKVAPPHKLPSLNCLNTTYTLVYVLIYIIIVIRIWKLHAFRTVLCDRIDGACPNCPIDCLDG